MRFEQKYELNEAQHKRILELLTKEPSCEEECMNEDEILFYTVSFGNKMEMDIKICGVAYEEGGDNLPWMEAVLFEDGHEVGCTDVSDEQDILGEWLIEYNGDEYVGIVTVA